MASVLADNVRELALVAVSASTLGKEPAWLRAGHLVDDVVCVPDDVGDAVSRVTQLAAWLCWGVGIQYQGFSRKI